MLAGPCRRPTPETAAVLRVLPQRTEHACQCREGRWHAPGDCANGGEPGYGLDATVATSRTGDRLCSGCFVNCADDHARHD